MNPLFPNNTPQQNNMSQISNIVKMLKSGNPEQIAMTLMQKNPQFKAFMDSNKGKTPQQVAQEMGIDFNSIKNLM